MTFPSLRVLCATLAIPGAVPAHAQTLDPDGVYVTKPAQEQRVRLLASDIARAAPKLEFDAASTTMLTKGVRDSSLTLEWDQGGQLVKTSDGTVRAKRPDQSSFLTTIIYLQTANVYPERFSTVRVEVVPAPPRDYKVVINGEDCTATERGIYRVVPGRVAVEVTRTPKPACAWKGDIAAGKEQRVNCSL